MSDMLRITGLATGLDVDEIVKSMMKAENIKLDKVKQDRQLVQWKQDLLRETIGDLNTFKSTYFDVVKQDTYMLSSSNYPRFDVTSYDNGDTSKTSSIVSATAGAGAVGGSYNIQVVKLAKADRIQGDALTSGTDLNTRLSQLGVKGSSSLTLTYKNGGATYTAAINISDKNKTIKDVINEINYVTSGEVVGSYSELTGKFTLQTSKTGANTSIKINGDTGGLLDALKITGTEGTGAQDAEVKITPPGASEPTTVTKSSNNFIIDNVTYNLLKESGDPATNATITLTTNPQKTFDKIKGFIEKYNEMISKIQTKISEKKQYDYRPLTDEQKKEMSEDDIKKWEERAKEGILRNDSSLQNMLNSMRRAFFDGVEGAGISLKEIGLTTDSDYYQGGKIIIDEAKLKKTISERGDQVADLFMKSSSIDYDPDHKTDKDRYKQIGIFQRLNDIMKDYTRTNRDSNSKKGILIERAGIKGDLSEYQNSITKELYDIYDKRINELSDRMADKQNRYYNKFAQLEAAIQRMNAQSSWLSQQFGSSGGN